MKDTPSYYKGMITMPPSLLMGEGRSGGDKIRGPLHFISSRQGGEMLREPGGME
jgi:hypothetical protein